MRPSFPSLLHRRQGFTLVEVLVSVAILAMMMLITTEVIGTAQKSWGGASARVTQFRQARQAFDVVNRNLRQASLFAYRDYYWKSGSQPSDALEPPDGIVRKADLGYRTADASAVYSDAGPGQAVMFQGPFGKTLDANYEGLNHLLCARGYFVRSGSDKEFLPRGLRGRLEERYRYRLYEFQPPTESNTVFKTGSDGKATGDWTTISGADVGENMRPVADNMILMLLANAFEVLTTSTGKVDLASQNEASTYYYTYDSYNPGSAGAAFASLPHSVRVVMIGIDENSAILLTQQNGGRMPDLVRESGVRFENPKSILSDLEKVTTALNKRRVNYRVFSAEVPVMASDSGS